MVAMASDLPCHTGEMRCGASFRVHGIDPAEVTALLGLEPNVPPRRPHSPWRLKVGPADGTELEVPLRSLLAQIADAEAGLRRLQALGAEFDFFCFIQSSAAEHASILSPDLLGQIAALGAELWLDFYEEPRPTR